MSIELHHYTRAGFLGEFFLARGTRPRVCRYGFARGPAREVYPPAQDNLSTLT